MSGTKDKTYLATILSALGTPVSALVGYIYSRKAVSHHDLTASPGSPAAPLGGTCIAVYNPPSGTWYFFSFNPGNSSKCRLFGPPGAYPSSAPPPSITALQVVDTCNWFISLSSTSKPITQTTPIQYLPNGGDQYVAITVSFTNDGYLDPTSLSNLLGLMAGPDYQQVAASWNEIGHN